MSSSPVAVAAADPVGDVGHGEAKQEVGQPKVAGSSPPAGDADVTMEEAAVEEEAAVAAEVKAEGKAAATAKAADVAREGGDAAAVSDPLYSTESAGMIGEEGCGDEPVDSSRALDGGDSREEEARVLQNETEAKPVPAGDAAIAVETMGASGSASPEHAGVETSEPETNNGYDGIEIEGKDNGVAHRDKEMENDLVTGVEGSSGIEEDDGASPLEQQDDRSEMRLPEHAFESGNSESNATASSANCAQCARYCLPPLDKGDFRVSDLVWGKVKSHPWWPGEIFDPSDASELALKHQKKGSHLVAYFGDNTFAWCDESQLKPFVSNYSQMEKQSSSDAFVSSVNYALEELSRRILSGMSCSCLSEELSDNGMSYMVENAGLKDGVTCSAVNRSEILTCFSPENLLTYIKSLALFPGQGGDLLELVIACSQLTSFYRSKGCPELASFQTGSAWVESGMDNSSAKDVIVEEVIINEVQPCDEKPKRGRGRPRKQKPEDGLEFTGKKATSNLSNDTTYGHPVERQLVMDFDDFAGLENKKKRNLDSFEDSETKSQTPTSGSSFKIGECIRRAASQLTGPSSIVKSQNEQTAHKNTAEAENGEFDISSDDAVNEISVEKRVKRRRMHRNHAADPMELLWQLCSVAAEPMNGYSFSAMIINYFSDYRNFVVSSTTEANVAEKSTSRKGRKRKVLPSPEVETTDHMQDSYWSGLSLHNHPVHSLRRASTNTRPRRRRRSSQGTHLHSQQSLQIGTSSPKKHVQVIERSIIHVNEKMVDECKPTALVLSFGRSAALPSETVLIKMFGRYGPLKESETEVNTSTNTVKVVFKKRADAERAFSIAGKSGTFGPSLRSYRLVNMPFSLGSSETNKPEAHPEYHGLEIPGPSESKVQPDAMQIDQVDKTDKAETVKESSAGQDETTKQRCQTEAGDSPLIDQVDMVEKTEQTNSELTEQADQIGTHSHCVQTETIVEESSEQVSMIEQAHAQNGTSLEDQSEIAQSGAADGASNGGMADGTQPGDDPNKESAEVPSDSMQMEVASEAQTGDTIRQDLHAEATNDESREVTSDTLQVDVVAEAPKQDHVCGDNTVFEAAEASITAEDDTTGQPVQEASAEVIASAAQTVIVPETLEDAHVLSDASQFKVQTEDAVHVISVDEQAKEEPLNETSEDVLEADTENVIPEGTSQSLDLQAPSSTENPREEDATQQSMQFQEASTEIPCDAKLESGAFMAEPSGQVSTDNPAAESAAILTDDAPADTSELQASIVRSETVQLPAVCETSEEQKGKHADAEIFEDLKKASPQEAGSNKQIAELETAIKVSGGQAEVEKQTAGDVSMAEATTNHPVMDDGAVVSKVKVTVEGSVDDKAAAETLAEEAADGETTGGAQDVKTAMEATAEALVEETTTVVETTDETTADRLAEEKTTVVETADEAIADTLDEKKVNEATAEALAEEKVETTDEATADALAEETAEGETTQDEKTVSEAAPEALAAETTEGKTRAEAVSEAAPEALAAETTEGKTRAEAQDEETMKAEKTVEEATIEAHGGQASASEQTG